MDFSFYDIYDDIISEIQYDLDAGKILDPRHPNATKQSREQYRVRSKFLSERRAQDLGIRFSL